MAHLVSVRQPIGRCIFQSGACTRLEGSRSSATTLVSLTFARFASRSKGPPKTTQAAAPGKPGIRRSPEPYARKRHVDSSMKAASLLNHLAKAKKALPSEPKVAPPKVDVLKPDVVAPAEKHAPIGPEKGPSKTGFVEIPEKELYIQQVIVKNRSKLLWPGIWTIFAVAGTYGTLAFLDAKFSTPQIANATVHERATIPQTWYLTPGVIKEGVIAGWHELDKLTIGIVVASIGFHLLKKSPLPIWEKMVHITGEKKYTALLYPYVHGSWLHLGMNMLGLCWFLPGVVHHFDNDLFHSAALFTTVPLITSYLQHFAFRFTNIPGVPLNIGSSGAIAAIIGAFCMLYPDEKVWTPNFLVFRLDAKYVGSVFAAWQIASMVNAPKGNNRPAFLVSLTRAMLEPRAD
jgi:membrane associated rhomboid family serine protease